MEFVIEDKFVPEYTILHGDDSIEVSLSEQRAVIGDLTLNLKNIDTSNHIIIVYFDGAKTTFDLTALILGEHIEKYIAVPTDGVYEPDTWVLTNDKYEYDRIRFGTKASKARPIKARPKDPRWGRRYLDRDKLDAIGYSLDDIIDGEYTGDIEWELSFGNVTERMNNEEWIKEYD